MWTDVEDAIWRELGAYYMADDMPLSWTDASRRAFLERAAAGSAWRLGQRLKGDQRVEAAALLRSMSKAGRGHPVIEQALKVSQYAWFYDETRQGVLVALLQAIADRIDAGE